MELIITLIAAIVVFALLWYAVRFVPVPADLAWIRNVLYLILILLAAWFLWTRFVR